MVYRDNNPVGDVDIDNNGDGVDDVKCFSVSTTASASVPSIASTAVGVVVGGYVNCDADVDGVIR